MDTRPEERTARARCALEGLSVGDAFGERFFNHKTRAGLEARQLPPGPWGFTDDTNMALSIFAILQEHGAIDQDALARDFARRFGPGRGYGPGMHRLLPRLAEGAPWREEAGSLFGGEGSLGNGAAMRVAPVGGYFADDLEAAAEQARLSSEVTHSHPEGIAGAVATAVAGAVAWQLRGEPPPARAAFIDRVLPLVPESKVRERLLRARDLKADTSLQAAIAHLGNGSQITCMDTVPFVLWCAGERLHSYEEALWLTAAGGGDVDTTCAMVGGIVVMYTGDEDIPEEWRRRREPLPL